MSAALRHDIYSLKAAAAASRFAQAASAPVDPEWIVTAWICGDVAPPDKLRFLVLEYREMQQYRDSADADGDYTIDHSMNSLYDALQVFAERTNQ